MCQIAGYTAYASSDKYIHNLFHLFCFVGKVTTVNCLCKRFLINLLYFGSIRRTGICFLLIFVA
ncbi:hypothetical protein BFAG_00496 [Bacteroides fragilis 3_1_12]|uniref:Uncharacterized protein n=1 Tax=Bacteroides fragilis 3_1_12 TaxID=457424 RepID=A0ABN0BFT6_BACFG|nr:hypothetical protein BFAG_00496 [Bacteroides fragilis 3_1_12]